MKDPDLGEAFARGLADLGCGPALDDFGPGFGSFTYLKRLPVTHLKIDIEFVRDLLTYEANRRVVKVIVGLAEAFGLQTVAEGDRAHGTVLPARLRCSRDACQRRSSPCPNTLL
jgi:EAL domain-containing protein (putative c-di-GMP-specific phosphodiesterase class I)